MTDPLQQLKTLADLRDSGVITNEEFNVKKAELLNMVGAEAGLDRSFPDARSSVSAEIVETQTNPLDLESCPSGELVGKVGPTDVEFWRTRSESFAARAADAKSRLKDCQRDLKRTKRAISYWLLLLQIRGRFLPIWRFGSVIISTWLGGMIGVAVSVAFKPGLGLALALIGVLAFFGFSVAYHLLYYPDTRQVRFRFDELKEQQTPLESELERLEREYKREHTAHQNAVEVYGRMREAYGSTTHKLLSTDWRSLRGVPLEEFLQRVFENAGYLVELTKASGDQGVDLLLTRSNERIAVQVKGYVSSVGNAAVQQAHAGMSFYRCTKCAVITNSEFTSSARELASRVGCTLIEGSQIEALILGQIGI